MMVHMISFLMMMGAVNFKLQPAMFLENFFTAYSVLVMVYLSVRKFFCHAVPFKLKDKKVHQSGCIVDLRSKTRGRISRRCRNQTHTYF
jgi:hypothetical protein